MRRLPRGRICFLSLPETTTCRQRRKSGGSGFGGEEHRREDAANSCTNGHVEVVCDGGVLVVRFLLQRGFRVGKGFSDENLAHAAVVDGENAYLVMLVLTCGDAIQGGGSRRSLRFRLGRYLLGEPELWIVVVEEKLAFKNLKFILLKIEFEILFFQLTKIPFKILNSFY